MTTNKPEVVAWLHSVRQDSDVITDKVRHVWGTPRGSMGEYTEPLIRLSDYEALQAECEKLRKDAERYRWLRERWARLEESYADGDSDQLVAIREADSHFEGWDVDPLSLDQAIDAALAAHRKQGGGA